MSLRMTAIFSWLVARSTRTVITMRSSLGVSSLEINCSNRAPRKCGCAPAIVPNLPPFLNMH